MLGLAYAAAAFAKFDEHGLEWITRGAVRYFFVIDARDAPSELGRAIASSDTLAVLFSAGAVVCEMFVVLAAIWPGTLLTLVAGCVALTLHAGFYLFQGVYWPARWALLPAFLPWQWMVTIAQTRMRRFPGPQLSVQQRPAAHATTGWAWATGSIVFLAVLQQPIASLLRQEYWFLMSDFPMYSHLDHDSKEAFAAHQDQHNQPPAGIRFDVRDGDGGAFESHLLRVDPTGSIVSAAQVLARGAEPSSSEVAMVRDVAERYRQAFGAAPEHARVLARTWQFDWAAAGFVMRPEWALVATLDLSSGRFVVPRDRLLAGARLLAGQSLVSPSGRYRLVYQVDGNLVLYDDGARIPLWSSDTPGTSPGRVAMQENGDLVLHDRQGRLLWSTGTAGNVNAFLAVQNDGNLILLGSGGQPLWSN